MPCPYRLWNATPVMALQAALNRSIVSRSAACCSSVGMSLTISVRFMFLVYHKVLNGFNWTRKAAVPLRA